MAAVTLSFSPVRPALWSGLRTLPVSVVARGEPKPPSLTLPASAKAVVYMNISLTFRKFCFHNREPPKNLLAIGLWRHVYRPGTNALPLQRCQCR